ncbi:MAG: hypothetical protein FJZ98_05360, partial [Chloroflexi bacterium]|nr:hypothetical protein [Chloroflexota bacterium]
MNKSIILKNRFAFAIKIILLSASFYIFWSILALLSSIFQPFSKFSTFPSTNGPSDSLADSLFLEIIQSYFSIFSITVLVIIGLSGIIGFFWAKNISNEIFPFHEDQSPFTILIKRIFDINPFKIKDLSDHHAVKEFNDFGRRIYGPAKIRIPDLAMAIISKGISDFRGVTSDGYSPIQIGSTESLEKILPPFEKEFRMELINPISNGAFKSILVRYRFKLNQFNERFDQTNLQFLLRWISSDWREFFESIVRLEFSHLVKTELMFDLEMKTNIQEGIGFEIDAKKIHQKPHSVYFSTLPLIRKKISRNRKRGIYPLASSDSVLSERSE